MNGTGLAPADAFYDGNPHGADRPPAAGSGDASTEFAPLPPAPPAQQLCR